MREATFNHSSNTQRENINVDRDYSYDVRCHLLPDIEAVRERLSVRGSHDEHGPLDALRSLSNACSGAGIWRGTSNPSMASKNFHLLEEYAEEWAESTTTFIGIISYTLITRTATGFESALHKTGSLMAPTAPREVMDHLRAAHPNQVREGAWLVMYYCVILNTVSSPPLKEKLRHNLCLALGDVGVLLEPSEANIQALVLVLSQASEVAGPSLQLDARHERVQDGAGDRGEPALSRQAGF